MITMRKGSQNPGICDRNVAFFNTAALHMRIPLDERDKFRWLILDHAIH